jgi:hypothetical protein
MYFDLSFDDLKYDKQEEMIESVAEVLRQGYKAEMEGVATSNDLWEEAFIRAYEIEYLMWKEEEDAKTFDWKQAVDDHARREAEEKLNQAFRYLEVETEE